jgi:hypothetical protein
MVVGAPSSNVSAAFLLHCRYNLRVLQLITSEEFGFLSCVACDVHSGLLCTLSAT